MFPALTQENTLFSSSGYLSGKLGDSNTDSAAVVVVVEVVVAVVAVVVRTHSDPSSAHP